jgi:hypothetical protein
LIPAYTLWPNTNYAVSLNFYHFRYATNGTANLTQAFRVTNLNLVLTTLADTSALTLGSPSYSSNTFGFDVFTFPGANVTIEYNTNLAIESWQKLYSTNSPSYRFGFNTPLGTNQSMFFRVRTGP